MFTAGLVVITALLPVMVEFLPFLQGLGAGVIIGVSAMILLIIIGLFYNFVQDSEQPNYYYDNQGRY